MDISEEGLLPSRRVVQKAHPNRQERQNRCPCRVFTKLPYPGYWPDRGACLSFNCAELPRSKRILEATGYRYPVAFSICAPCAAACIKARRPCAIERALQSTKAPTTVVPAPHCIHCHHPSRGLRRRFAAGSPTDYPQVACDRNCKQNACALRQPSAGTMPQLHRAPRDGP